MRVAPLLLTEHTCGQSPFQRELHDNAVACAIPRTPIASHLRDPARGMEPSPMHDHV